MKAVSTLFALLIISLTSCNLVKKNRLEATTDLITEKYWKLKILEGKKVSMAENQEREIYFILKSGKNQLVGFAGCNVLSGEFILEKGNRIRFTNVVVTKKSCPEVAVNEVAFLKVLNLTNKYTVKGDVLSLSVGRREPLAVFEAVYLK